MSTQDKPPPAPRIVLEAGPDATLILECYVNGQRSRTTLTRGIELHEIRDELDRQARQLEAKRLTDLEAEEAKRRALHRHNLHYIRSNYGDNFAKRVYGEHFAPTPERSAPRKVGIEANVDLL